MILYLNNNASMNDMEHLCQRLKKMGLETRMETEGGRKSIAVIGGMDEGINIALFEQIPLVKSVINFNSQLKLAGKDIRQQPSVVTIDGLNIGSGAFTVIAGPCSIESRDQIMEIAKGVSAKDATVLRGGAFKPRTSPYDFQGLGEEGLQFLREAADTFGLRCVSEVMSTDDVNLVERYVDILQIGSRNMQNYSLLKAVGKAKKPVLLKRGLSATYKEFLSAAEYIISSGNPNVMLCERGIRTFEPYTRNTLDLAAVPVLRELTHLPIIVDPSHGVGLRHAVPVMANAAIAVKADGLMVEAHTSPDESISDATQTISIEQFSEMMGSLRAIGEAVGMPINSIQKEVV